MSANDASSIPTPAGPVDDDFIASLEEKHGVTDDSSDAAVADAARERGMAKPPKAQPEKPEKPKPAAADEDDDDLDDDDAPEADDDESQEELKPAAKDGPSDDLPEGVTEEQFEAAEEVLLREGLTQDVIDSMDAERVLAMAAKLTKAAAPEEPAAKPEKKPEGDALALPAMPQSLIDELGEETTEQLSTYLAESMDAVIGPLMQRMKIIADAAGREMATNSRHRLSEDFPELKEDATYDSVLDRMRQLDATKFNSMDAMMRAAVGSLRADPEAIEREKRLKRRRRRDRARSQPRPPARKSAVKAKPKTREEQLDEVIAASEKKHGVS